MPIHFYYSADWQVLQEGPDFGVTAQYVWSPVYGDGLVLRDRNMDGNGSTIDAADERLYVQQDANWNVTAVVGWDVPTSAWVVKERYVYDPYGQATAYNATWLAGSTANLGWVYYHQGGRLDGTTGFYHFRNRDYSPTLGRWISVDSLGFGGGDTSLNRARGNNPGNISFGLHAIVKAQGPTRHSGEGGAVIPADRRFLDAELGDARPLHAGASLCRGRSLGRGGAQPLARAR